MYFCVPYLSDIILTLTQLILALFNTFIYNFLQQRDPHLSTVQTSTLRNVLDRNPCISSVIRTLTATLVLVMWSTLFLHVQAWPQLLLTNPHFFFPSIRIVSYLKSALWTTVQPHRNPHYGPLYNRRGICTVDHCKTTEESALWTTVKPQRNPHFLSLNWAAGPSYI